MRGLLRKMSKVSHTWYKFQSSLFSDNEKISQDWTMSKLLNCKIELEMWNISTIWCSIFSIDWPFQFKISIISTDSKEDHSHPLWIGPPQGNKYYIVCLLTNGGYAGFPWISKLFFFSPLHPFSLTSLIQTKKPQENLILIILSVIAQIIFV